MSEEHKLASSSPINCIDLYWYIRPYNFFKSLVGRGAAPLIPHPSPTSWILPGCSNGKSRMGRWEAKVGEEGDGRGRQKEAYV